MPLFASILGLLVALGFLVLGVVPRLVVSDVPPLVMRAILVASGAFMLLVALAALRHATRVRALLRSGTPEPAHVAIEVDESSDGTSYTAVATVGGGTKGNGTTGGEVWAVPVYGGAGVRRLLKGEASRMAAWRDPATGAPVEFEIDGRRVRTYPSAIRRR